MLITPQNLAALIIYIIGVVAFWESIGTWGFLFVPVIWIGVFIFSGINDSAGTRMYGNKWNDMTQHEREMQIKKDTIINDLYNKKK